MAQSKPKRAKQDPAMLLEEELDLICDWDMAFCIVKAQDLPLSPHVKGCHSGTWEK